MNSNALKEINLFSKKNEQLRNCFFFFFFVAILGYASVMISMCPYSDDYCRYFANMPVGTTYSARYATFFLECLMYFSTVVTDAAPFTQIMSCAFLAYIAIILIKILAIDINDKYAILCLVPAVVNPYLLECMMYRFDNPFMMLALSCVVISVYLARTNNKKLLFIQVILLFQSLLMYQPASSAFFVICAYFFLIELASNKAFFSIIYDMRYKFYTLLITAICYLPVMLCTAYRRSSGKMFLVPINSENIRQIFENISRYLANLYTDWMCNIVGQIFFILIALFVISYLIEVFLNNVSYKISSISRYLVINTSAIVIFLISPLGICAFLVALTCLGYESINPRILYCFGIFVSMILYRNYLLFKKNEILKQLYVIFLLLFGIWNMVFLNSAGNIIHKYRISQKNILYDLSKDVSYLIKENNKISHICVQGSMSSQATENFFKLYPIMTRIIPDKWQTPSYCILGLFNYEIAEYILKYGPIEEQFKEEKYSSKKLLKSHLWYDIYSMDDEVLLLLFKKDDKFRNPASPMLRIREKD